MLKKNLTREESLSLAANLGLTKYIAIDNLINGLQIEKNNELKIYIITTDKEVAESLCSKELDLDVRLNSNHVLKLKAHYGESICSVVTNYGELYVDRELLKKTLISTNKAVECTIGVPNESLKNLSLTLIYTPEYNCVNDDTWRCTMLESDKTIMALSANHILYTSEKEFICSYVIPFHSPSRLQFGVGNAQNIKSSEWTDVIERMHILIGVDYEVFPIFTDEITSERRDRYAGCDTTLDSILRDAQKNSLDLRKKHFEDLGIYKFSLLETSLIELKRELENKRNVVIANASSVEIDKKTLVESRKRIERVTELFLETPLIAKYRSDVDEFAEILKKSMKEEILESVNIRQDARVIPRYLTAIWSQFSEDQNIELYNVFKRESTVLIDAMNVELRQITRDVRNFEIKSDVKKLLDSAFCINTFFARRTDAGGSFTDILTIGGLLGTLFTSWGLVAVLASEVVKIAGKKSMENDYKNVLVEKIVDVIEKNKEELRHQADTRFAKVAELFRAEIMNYYDEIICSITDAIDKEKERLAHATETIELITQLIN